MSAVTPVFSIEVDGTTVLAVDTGLDRTQFARAGTARLVVESGMIVSKDGSAVPWKIEGTGEAAGKIFVYGPSFPAESYAETVARDPAVALEALRTLCAAVAMGAELPLPVPAAIRVSEDGRVLVLPPSLVLRALQSTRPGYALDGVGRWSHPDLRGERAAAFTLASLSYALVCGRLPFPSNDSDRCVADMREGNFPPSTLVRPGIKPELGRTLDGILGKDGGDTRRSSTADLSAALGNPGSGGIPSLIETVSDDEASRAEFELKRFETRKDRESKRKRFYRAHGAFLVGLGAAIAVIALFAWNFISGQASRFTTKGLSPAEVVGVYYDAFDKLDTERMDGCIAGDAGKADRDAATNMFVIFRVRQAYERDAPYLRAADWLAAGSPETEKAVFGIVDLKIEKASAENEFIATYRLFAPGSPEQTREDRLTLSRLKGNWRITGLERAISGESTRSSY